MDINTNTNAYNPALNEANKTSNTVASNSRNPAAAQNAGEFIAPSKTTANLTALNAPASSPLSAILQSLTTLLNQLTGGAAAKQEPTSQPSTPAQPQSLPVQGESAPSEAPTNYADSLQGLQSADMTSSAALDAARERIADTDFTNSSQLRGIYSTLNGSGPASTALRAELNEIANLTGNDNSATRTLAPVGNNSISAARLQAALILASSDDNFNLNIEGNINVSTPIRVFPTGDLTVNAEGANFIGGDRIDDDLISIDATEGTAAVSASDRVDVSWTGGTFDISRSLTASSDSPLVNQLVGGNNRVSDASIIANVESLIARPGETAGATTDGLSIRGTNNSNVQHIESANVEGIRVVGLPVEDRNAPFDDLETSTGRTQWTEAGGDSGLFVQGVNRLDATDNEFFGIRDAAIYVTASGRDRSEGETNFGENYNVSNNRINNAFDGISSKRGANNITINNNTINDVVTAISTKKTQNDEDDPEAVATGVSISGNDITRANRGILLEVADDVTVTNNSITELGIPTGGFDTAVNSSERGTFEGIVFEGVRGSNNVSGNTITPTNNSNLSDLAGVGGVISRIIGISQRDFNQGGGPSERTGVTFTPGDNSFTGFSASRESDIEGNSNVSSINANRVSFTRTADVTTG